MSIPGALSPNSEMRAAWLMLGGAFAAFTISAALMHAYPVYLVAFIEAFGWSRAETSIAYSVSQLVGGSARRWSACWSIGSGRAGCC